MSVARSCGVWGRHATSPAHCGAGAAEPVAEASRPSDAGQVRLVPVDPAPLAIMASGRPSKGGQGGGLLGVQETPLASESLSGSKGNLRPIWRAAFCWLRSG